MRAAHRHAFLAAGFFVAARGAWGKGRQNRWRDRRTCVVLKEHSRCLTSAQGPDAMRIAEEVVPAAEEMTAAGTGQRESQASLYPLVPYARG